MNRAPILPTYPLTLEENCVISELAARHLKDGSSGRWIDGVCDFVTEREPRFAHFMAYLMADKLRYRSPRGHDV